MAKTERTRLKNRCIKLAKDIAKLRDRYTCQHCGKSQGRHGVKIDASHVLPVSTCGGRLACDPLNIKALCARCHLVWWHENPIESGAWFEHQFPDRAEYLHTQKVVAQATIGTIPIGWWRERVEELKQELKDLKDQRSNN